MRNFYYLCTLLLIMIISSCKTATKVVKIPVEIIKKEYINSIKIDRERLTFDKDKAKTDAELKRQQIKKSSKTSSK